MDKHAHDDYPNLKYGNKKNRHCKTHEHARRRSYDYKVLTVSIYQIEKKQTKKIHIEEKNFDMHISMWQQLIMEMGNSSAF